MVFSACAWNPEYAERKEFFLRPNGPLGGAGSGNTWQEFNIEVTEEVTGVAG